MTASMSVIVIFLFVLLHSEADSFIIIVILVFFSQQTLPSRRRRSFSDWKIVICPSSCPQSFYFLPGCMDRHSIRNPSCLDYLLQWIIIILHHIFIFTKIFLLQVKSFSF